MSNKDNKANVSKKNTKKQTTNTRTPSTTKISKTISTPTQKKETKKTAITKKHASPMNKSTVTKPVITKTTSTSSTTKKKANTTAKDYNTATATKVKPQQRATKSTKGVPKNKPVVKPNETIKHPITPSSTVKHTIKQEKKEETIANKSIATRQQRVAPAPKKHSLFKRFFSGLGKFIWVTTCLLFSLIFLSTIVGTFFAYQIFLDFQGNLPPLSIEQVRDKMRDNSLVLDKYDQGVADLAEESFIPVTFDELPQALIDGFHATEDSRFLTHKGIDGPRTLNAVVTNSILKKVTSGGSTITQQLIKVTSLKNKIALEETYKDSDERKVHEWILAYQLEQKMSKEDIFTAYLNTLGYGRLVGVGTASKNYFNKHVSQLSLAEAALLSGIPQASSTNNPYSESIEKPTQRYQTVIDSLRRHDYINDVEQVALKQIPLADLLLINQDEFTQKNAAYFSAIEEELNGIFNINSSDKDVSLPYYTGYKIYTELDQEQQKFANEIMDTENYVKYSEMLQNIPYYRNNDIYDDPNLQAAFAVVDVKTGGVPAIGAARNFKLHGNNFAINGFRSPGSSIKPVIDYAPGMEKFGWTTSTPFIDKKTYYSGTRNEVFNFSNSTTEKPVTLQQAVSESLNTVAVQAIQQVGVEYAGTIAGNLGISRAIPLLAENHLFESAALGGGLETTVVEMAGAYAAFGNAGQFNKPHFIRRIENEKGETVYQYKQQNTQVIGVTAAKNMTGALVYTRFNGTPSSGRHQVNRNITFAAKTGTSSYGSDERRSYGLSGRAEKDHWIVGYSPEYSIATWTGFNIESPEFLTKTKGNTNANKGYGSHIMAAWMNRFAPTGTSFDFDKQNNPRATISPLAATLDRDLKTIFWNKPIISYPTAMDSSKREEIGPLVYDIYGTNASGEESLLITLPQNILNYNYSDTGIENLTNIRVNSRFTKELPDLTDSSSVILSVQDTLV
ncbi:MAG: transglycosylase domain-containing protein [Culicoidibacterales bacterium]